MIKHAYAMNPPTLIETPDDLRKVLAVLIAEPVIAVDTESNSLYVYREQVCLLQFSVPDRDYLVDPLAVGDLSVLRPLFADPGIEKVFHAAEYDVMVLRRDYGFGFANLFDTMIASRIVGWRRYGLGNLLREHFGVQTNKRMQRTNWGKRPLSPEQLEYARLDTHYLLPLREKLNEELSSRGRLEEARGAFSRVAQSQWTEKEFDPEGFWRVRGAKHLDGSALAVLRLLYTYRDKRARALDLPPFKVLSDAVLVRLSQEIPRNVDQLAVIKGLPRRLPFRERKRILSLIERGLQGPRPRKAKRRYARGPDEAAVNRYEALRTWRKERAAVRGVEPDVILSNQTLQRLAHHNPASAEKLHGLDIMSDWERQEYGREILAVLRRQSDSAPS